MLDLRLSLNIFFGRPRLRLPDVSSPQNSCWGDSGFVHTDHMSSPTQMGLEQLCLYTRGASFLENLKTGDLILPADLHDLTVSEVIKA